MTDTEPALDVAADDARERSLPEDIRQLAADARTLAEAEFAYQKSRAAYAGQEIKGITVLGIVAAVLVFFAVMGLVLGAILALSPAIGAWGATAVVVGLLLVIALLCVLTAGMRWKRMKAMLADEGHS
ncbi:MAG: phage holin family protein [Novosphingobium sp.]|nr:phage holin family protein [Novosphingobium sp.]